MFQKCFVNCAHVLTSYGYRWLVQETFDYHDRMYLVLELCSGGDLYSRDPYDEEQACKIACSVVDAVNYMHSKGITHRDLKYENIMFSNPSTYSVKLIDFGLSKKYAMKEHLHDTVGKWDSVLKSFLVFHVILTRYIVISSQGRYIPWLPKC
jgi:serine/threonine protein kinase